MQQQLTIQQQAILQMLEQIRPSANSHPDPWHRGFMASQLNKAMAAIHGQPTLAATELQARYAKAARVVTAEKAMREHVFRSDDAKRATKVAEMDAVLAVLDELATLAGLSTGEPSAKKEAAPQPSLFEVA